MENRKIIFGLHSSGYAKSLVSTLRAGGVDACIHMADIEVPEGEEAPVYVMVPVDQAVKSVRLIENNQFMAPYKVELKLAGMSRNLLIPVDLTDSSILACRIGFALARRLQLTPVLLHVFSVPYPVETMPDTTFPSLDDNVDPVEEMELTNEVRNDASVLFDRFRKKLDEAIAAGEIADLKYETELSQGIPEEVILEYTRQTPPSLVVMATRDYRKKSSELMGSVTAEVLDSCRVPVFTVPENDSISDIKSIRRLAYFCNLDDQDIYSIEFLMKMFDYPDVEITLAPAVKGSASVDRKMKSLYDYLCGEYPDTKFVIANVSGKDVRKEYEQFISSMNIELLIVPNKKKNIFSRIFNPGIPHRILFEKDIPMLALPV